MFSHEKILALLTLLRIKHLHRLGRLGWEGTRLQRVRLSGWGERGPDESCVWGRDLKPTQIQVCLVLKLWWWNYLKSQNFFCYCQKIRILSNSSLLSAKSNFILTDWSDSVFCFFGFFCDAASWPRALSLGLQRSILAPGDVRTPAIFLLELTI